MATYALIPAHNEEQSIASSVASVIGQVDQVVVISDNSTDATVQRARAERHGLEKEKERCTEVTQARPRPWR